MTFACSQIPQRLGLLFVASICCVTLSCRGKTPELAAPQHAAPRRVILITIDTLRADHLGFDGYPRPTSPFLDRLAERSVVFTNAFSPSSHTAPAHTSLFTSLYPAQHQLLENGQTLHESVLTMAEVFSAEGYRTAGFSTVGFTKELAQGFEHYHSERSYFPAGHVLAAAKGWLESQPDSSLVFVWIHLFDVHEWHNDDALDPNTSGEVKRGSTLEDGKLITFLQDHQGNRPGFHRGKERMLERINRYDDQILSVDRHLESFHTWYEEKGLGEDSLWIVTADHGEGLGSHGWLGHGANIYNEQTRVPLLLHFADARYPPREEDRLVGLVDLLPTAAELLQASLDGQVFPVVGRSLLPLLGAPETDWPDRWLYAQRRPADLELRRDWEQGEIYSLQTVRHKYIAKTEHDDELYDLEADPLELNNIITQSLPIKDSLARELAQLAAAMAQQGAELTGTGIDPEHIKELKALGYL